MGYCLQMLRRFAFSGGGYLYRWVPADFLLSVCVWSDLRSAGPCACPLLQVCWFWSFEGFFFALDGLPNIRRLVPYLMVKYLRSHPLGDPCFPSPFNSAVWKT